MFLKLLISFLLHLWSVSAQEEFCSKFEPDITPKTFVVSINDEYQGFVQTACVQYFQVSIPPAASNRYLIFEVLFSSLPNNTDLMPILTGRVGGRPEIDLKGQVTTHSRADINSFRNRKLYHSITIDLQDEVATNLYFAVYQNYLNQLPYKSETIEYKVTTRTSPKYICPRDCSNNGKCDQRLKKCICIPSKMDIDCSLSADLIPFGASVSQNIPPNSWSYFYIEVKDYKSDLMANFYKNSGTFYLSFLFVIAQDFIVPNFIANNQTYMFASENDRQFSFPQNIVKIYEGGKLMIGAFNYDNKSSFLGIRLFSNNEEPYSADSAIYVCFILTSTLVPIILIIVAYRYRACLKRVARRLAETHVSTPPAGQEIEKYFPKIEYNQFKSSFSQTLCSICLENFNSEAVCRQLYCQHIYHDKCIDAWLGKHKNCPNCKKEMTREAIEKFLTNQNETDNKRSSDYKCPYNENSSPQKQNSNAISSLPKSHRECQKEEIGVQNRILEIGCHDKEQIVGVSESGDSKIRTSARFKEEKWEEELDRSVTISKNKENVDSTCSKVFDQENNISTNIFAISKNL